MALCHYVEEGNLQAAEKKRTFWSWVLVVEESYLLISPVRWSLWVGEGSLRLVGKFSGRLLLGEHSVGSPCYFFWACLELLAGLLLSSEEE